MKSVVCFDKSILIGRNALRTCKKAISLLWLAIRIFEAGFLVKKIVSKSQYVYNLFNNNHPDQSNPKHYAQRRWFFSKTSWKTPISLPKCLVLPWSGWPVQLSSDLRKAPLKTCNCKTYFDQYFYSLFPNSFNIPVISLLGYKP